MAVHCNTSHICEANCTVKPIAVALGCCKLANVLPSTINMAKMAVDGAICSTRRTESTNNSKAGVPAFHRVEAPPA